ncbi:MAG: TIGR01212 family radical SAM protein [Alistipes sp.]|nr:TIGR01212 family radical SAM protein [Alistipes sp.]
MHRSELPYNDYGSAMRRRMGGRVQKLAIDARLGCPHREAESGKGGCTFCLGEAFTPSYCQSQQSITEQINTAINFHLSRRRTADRYLAYFQAGTNTFAPLERLKTLYEEALAHPKIEGIIIGTRPDCISSEILDYLEYLSHKHYVAVEYGIEATKDDILRHVNRGHNFATAVEAVEATRARGIDVGAHFILGLPYQSREDILTQMDDINALKLDFVKFHQLQVYRNTPLAREWSEHPERFLFAQEFGVAEYVELMADVVRRLDSEVAIERFASQAPRNLILGSPLGGIRMDALKARIAERLNALNAKQGDLL